jgi:hypothetical protein
VHDTLEDRRQQAWPSDRAWAVYVGNPLPSGSSGAARRRSGLRQELSFVEFAANGGFEPFFDIRPKRSIRREGREADLRCTMDEGRLSGTKRSLPRRAAMTAPDPKRSFELICQTMKKSPISCLPGPKNDGKDAVIDGERLLRKTFR